MGKRARRKGPGRAQRLASSATSRSDDTRRRAASPRLAILWTGAALVAIAVAGVLLAPGLRLVWFVIFVFGIAAVPQAFRRDR
jgi:Flp pilus assembly protein TadB